MLTIKIGSNFRANGLSKGEIWLREFQGKRSSMKINGGHNGRGERYAALRIIKKELGIA